MITNLDNKLSSLTIMSADLADIFKKTIEADEYLFQHLESTDVALYIYVLRDLAKALYHEHRGELDTAKEYYEECKHFLEDR